jgi:hypothetical protein
MAHGICLTGIELVIRTRPRPAAIILRPFGRTLIEGFFRRIFGGGLAGIDKLSE